MTYKPQINPISEKLIESKSNDKKGGNVWDYLYKLDKELKEKRDQTHLEKKLQEEEECLKGCTFKPKIQKKENSYEIISKRDEDIYARNQQWKKNINEK